jgi:hypothetical protein
MIITERFTINGRDFIRTYSDSGCYVVRDGVSYGEANDPAEFGRVYTEGELMPPEEQPDRTEEEEALTRYANSITGASDQTLVEAAETLIIDKIKEE